MELINALIIASEVSAEFESLLKEFKISLLSSWKCLKSPCMIIIISTLKHNKWFLFIYAILIVISASASQSVICQRF